MHKLAKTCAIVIIMSPLLFLLTGQEWLYTPLKSFDGYLDIGYSFFFDDGNFHVHTYKAARTPWLSIIFYLQKLTGPYLLTPVLTVTFLLTVTTLYFLLIKTIFSTRTALVTIPWIVFFPHLFGTIAGGIAYNNTGAICYFLIGLILWAKRSPDDRKFFLPFLAGFFIASAIFTNIIYLSLLLLIPIIDLQLKKVFRIRDYVAAIAAFLLSIPFWGVVNLLHNRNFIFFSNMLYFIEKNILHPSNQSVWWVSLSELFTLDAFSSAHLVFIAALFFTALVQLCTKQNFSKTLTGHYAGLVFFWGAWHYTGQPTLYPSDFTYPQQIPCILMIASWIPAVKLSKKDICYALGSALFLWLCIYFSYPLKSFLGIVTGKSNLYLIPIAALTFTFLFAGPKSKYLQLGSIALIGLIFSATNYEPRSNAGFNCSVREQTYVSQIHMASNLIEISPKPSRFLFYLASVENKKLPAQSCLYENYLPLQELAKNLTFMIGYDFGEYEFAKSRSKEISKLTIADFSNFQGYLVLFPFNSESFSSEFLARARSLGFNFQKTHSFVENVMGEQVPYEVYRRVDLLQI